MPSPPASPLVGPVDAVPLPSPRQRIGTPTLAVRSSSMKDALQSAQTGESTFIVILCQAKDAYKRMWGSIQVYGCINLLLLLQVINAISSVGYEEEIVTHSLIKICGVPLGLRV
jgi:hypothetical protein